MIRLLLVTVTCITLALLPMRSQAYVFLGTRYDHPCISYSDARLAPAVGNWVARTAIEDCGVEPPETADILLLVEDPWTHGARNLAMAGTTRWDGEGITLQCTIWVPWWFAEHITILTHEVGHCLGLDHSDVEGANMRPCGCNAISPDDRAAIVALYGPEPPVYSLVVPGLSVGVEGDAVVRAADLDDEVAR